MKQLCKLFTITYVCGLFFNASLIVIVLISWSIDALPFWFRLLFAVAPVFFLAAGYFVRKESPEFVPRDFVLASLACGGVLLLPAAALSVLQPTSVICWFLFPVSGDWIAAFGSLDQWSPLYSILGAVLAPLLFWLGSLLAPVLHPEIKHRTPDAHGSRNQKK